MSIEKTTVGGSDRPLPLWPRERDIREFYESVPVELGPPSSCAIARFFRENPDEPCVMMTCNCRTCSPQFGV